MKAKSFPLTPERGRKFPGAMEAYDALITDPERLRYAVNYLIRASLREFRNVAPRSLRSELLISRDKWKQLAKKAGGDLSDEAAHDLAYVEVGLCWLMWVPGLEMDIPEQEMLEMALASRKEG